ncbi:MAG: stage III sporulation protein AE [Peptococcaceae bacterium]|nr:stage III sporulation protein AE [Peptococcaceae bacterium]
MKQRILLVAVLTICLLFFWVESHPLAAARTRVFDLDPILRQQMSELNLFSMDEVLRSLEQEYAGFVPDLSITGIIEGLRGGEGQNSRQILANLSRFAFREVARQTSLLGRLLVLAILCALMKKLQDSLGANVGNIAYAVCFLVLVGVVLQSFSLLTQDVVDSVELMISLMYSLMPVLLSLLISLGAVGSAALLNPLIAATATTVSSIVATLVMPLLYFAGVLSLLNSFSDKLQVGKLSSLLKDVSIAIMGLSFTVFVGLSVVQGTAAGVADGIALRTAKYAVKNFVPVVGGLFADVFETVAGASLLLKNGIGIAGLLAVFILCAMPAIKVLVVVFIYRLAAAIIQPMGVNPVADALTNLAGILTVVAGALITVGIMFFILITVVIGTGNATLSIR